LGLPKLILYHSACQNFIEGLIIFLELLQPCMQIMQWWDPGWEKLHTTPADRIVGGFIWTGWERLQTTKISISKPLSRWHSPGGGLGV